MIAESLRNTIQLIETISKISPPEDKKLNQELSHLVEHMRSIELKLRDAKEQKEYLTSV